MGIKKIFNLHFTDKCNFHCNFCYVKKENKELALADIKIIVDKISNYFQKNAVTDGRINIAGGEPTTCEYLQEIIDYIVNHNIKASLITNGSLLTEKFVCANKNKLTMIGISIDSIKAETNRMLGRYCGNDVFDNKRLVNICNCIKENGITLKINVVVSKINQNEDIRQLLHEVNPDRFKILQMLPTNQLAEKNTISDSEFELYLKKYSDFKYVSEKITNIRNAYVIIDSQGYLTTENQHNDLRFNVLKDDLFEIIDKIDFNEENEALRYK